MSGGGVGVEPMLGRESRERTTWAGREFSRRRRADAWSDGHESQAKGGQSRRIPGGVAGRTASNARKTAANDPRGGSEGGRVHQLPDAGIQTGWESPGLLRRGRQAL